MSFYLETRANGLSWTREGCNRTRSGSLSPWETRAIAEKEMMRRKEGKEGFDDPTWVKAEYRLVPYRPLARQSLIDEILSLPDRAFCEVRPHEGRFRSVIVLGGTKGRGYISDPDFGGGSGDTEEAAAKSLASAIRADVRGDGKYAPHWNEYALEYRLLPAWKANLT